MQHRALNGYVPPPYPARDEVDERQLASHLPRRWAGHPLVAGAMAGLCLAPLPLTTAQADTSVPKAAAPARVKDKTKGKLVDIFAPGGRLSSGTDEIPTGAAPPSDQGDGRGAFGCVAVSPPAFLTESDARQIIIEELGRVGLRFLLDSRKAATIHDREVTTSWLPKDKGGPLPSGPGITVSVMDGFHVIRREVVLGPHVLDGYDPAQRIAFEYISESDYFKLGGERSMSTVQSYDFRRLANRVAEEAAEDSSTRIGVFYDPMARVKWVRGLKGRYEAARNVLGEEQLRAQVRAFIDRLRADKVL